MSMRDSVVAAVNGHNLLAVAISKIAKGRVDNGRPLSGEDARQIARSALIELGLDWSNILTVHAEFEPIYADLRKEDDA